MTTVLLVRHGRTAANASGVLAGWTPGVHLDETGRGQAEKVAQRLSGIPLTTIVASPLERTQQTAEAIAQAQITQRRSPVIEVDPDFGECDYGTWTGLELAKLRKKPMWQQIQGHPSSVTFPEGESLIAMQQRAVDAVRWWNRTIGPKGIYVVVSHGDVIKAIVADALGMHLDQFQRIAIDPASVSIIEYTDMQPFVVRTNDSGEDLSFLRPHRRKKPSETVVGGGAGR